MGTDFGIATLSTSDQSRAEIGRRFGTPDFMAPEQLAGDWDADHRSDIYSLGVVGFRARADGSRFSAMTWHSWSSAWRPLTSV